MKDSTKINDSLLILLAFSISFEYWNPFGLSEMISIVKIITILYLLSSVPLLLQRLSIRQIKPFIVPIWLYLLIEMISSLMHVEYVNSFNNILNFNVLQFSILFVFISNHLLQNKHLIPKMFKAYSFGVIMLSFLFLLGIGLDVDYEEGASRLILFGENSNGIGMKAVVGLLIMLSFILSKDEKKPNKIFYLISFIPIILMISATASRGALFSFFAGSFIMVILVRKKMSVKIPIFVLSAMAAVYLMNFFLSNELFNQRIKATVEEGHTGRDKLWDASYNIFIDNPILGVGRAGFLPNMKIYYGEAMGAHNMFLELLASTGVVGFFFFMIFYIKMLRYSLLDYLNNKNILLLLLSSIITMHVFKAGGAISSNFVWFIFIFIVSSSISNLNNNKISKSQNNKIIN